MFEKFRKYIEITQANKIARRYFIMNSFDGIVTVLGVITGSLFSGVIDPAIILGIGVSTALAMGISGMSGTLIAEKTERDLELKRLEESMLSDLSNSLYAEAQRFTVIYVSIVDAISPLLASLFTLSPLVLSLFNIIGDLEGIYLSIATALIYLFIMGISMGALTKKNILIEGLKMVSIGLLTTVIIYVVFGR